MHRSSSKRTARCLSSRDNAGQRTSEFGLDGVDQPVERAVQGRHSHCSDHLAVPHQRHIGGLLVAGWHQRRADRVDDGLDRTQQGMRLVHASPREVGAAGAADMSDVDVHVGRTIGERRFHDGGDDRRRRAARRRCNRFRTVRARPGTPIELIAAIGSVTCGPGWPSTNGSIVNSTRCTKTDRTQDRPTAHQAQRLHGSRLSSRALLTGRRPTLPTMLSMTLDSLRDEALDVYDETVALRRSLHEQPELGNDLPITRERVLESTRRASPRHHAARDHVGHLGALDGWSARADGAAARRHGRLAVARGHRLGVRLEVRRQHARLRPRHPHGDVVDRRQSVVGTP